LQVRSFFRGLLLLSAALGQSNVALGARVLSITTSKAVVEPGYWAVDVTRSFAPDSPEVHVVALLTETERGSRFTGRWISLDATDTRNVVIAAIDQQVPGDGRARLHFRLARPTNGWPAGNYRFDLYSAGKRVAKVGFAVIAGADQPATDAGIEPATPPDAPTPPAPLPLDPNRADAIRRGSGPS